MESKLVFEKTTSRSAFLSIIHLFLFLSLSFNALSNENQNLFYGIKTNSSFEESPGYRSAVKTFWKDKASRYSSIVKMDRIKSSIKLEKYKGQYNAYSTLENSFYNHEFVFYKPDLKNGEKAPLIIIVPPVVGITPMDYISANYFANNGFSVAVLKLNVPTGKLEFKLDEVGQMWKNYIDKVRAFIDVSHNLPGVDVKRIGIKGVSLGGITAALATGRDPRIKASVIFMGGIDLPTIMAHSVQPVVKKLRNKKMKELKLFDEKDYERLLRRKFKLGLPFLTDGREAKDYFLFVALEDDYVPVEAQVALRQKLGFPEALFLEKGHLLNGIFYSVHLKRMKEYFEKRFSMDAFSQN